MKLTSEFKQYQQKFQYTQEDMEIREGKLYNMEFELDEAQNQAHLLKLENQELQKARATFKADYDSLAEQKSECEREITRLEGCISDLQLNLTTSHQQFNKEACSKFCLSF